MTLDEDDGMGNYYVIQDAWNGRDEQLWRILKAEGGYIIKNKKNGACLAIFDSEGEEYEFIVANGTAAVWTITEKTADLTKAKMSVPVSAALINGKATVEPTLNYGYRTLVKGKEYSVSFSNNTKAGDATVTAKGIGYITGSQKGTFTVVNSAASITSGKVYMIYFGGTEIHFHKELERHVYHHGPEIRFCGRHTKQFNRQRGRD